MFVPCDSCRQRSLVRYLWEGPEYSTRELTFCGHHANKYEALLPDAVRLDIEEEKVEEVEPRASVA